MASACLYCHAPHGGMPSPTPLWNQQLSVQTCSDVHQFDLPPDRSPAAAREFQQTCLSCHDGTVAPGQTVAFGTVMMGGTMKATSKFGTDLKSSHPFSMNVPLVDSPEISAVLFGAPPKTLDPAVNLVNGSVECTTCHQPHFQNIDKIVSRFLVRESSNGSLCLACHDPTRMVNGQGNYLAGWSTSVHATATNGIQSTPYVGGYPTVSQNACNSCHMPHNASGPARLLRGADEQDCIACHNGSNLQPAAPNVFSEYAKTGHPFPSANNLHDRSESTLLNNNRHATCVDCHDPHASQQSAVPRARARNSFVAGFARGHQRHRWHDRSQARDQPVRQLLPLSWNQFRKSDKTLRALDTRPCG